jgi:hypothetical protein
LSPAKLESGTLDPELLEPATVELAAADTMAAEPKVAEPTPLQSLPVEPAPLAAAPIAAEESPRPDPLEVAMAPVDPGHWIRAIDPDPERGTLQLVLAAPFTALPEAQQLQQAESWQTQALALGFDRLELTDRQGRPIGRQARVGSGMILLTRIMQITIVATKSD